MVATSSNNDENQSSRRGEETRHALILAGLDLFGEYGIKGTSTRMLSEHAGTNVAAISYHFGNKEGLYKAVVTYIAERASELNAQVRAEIQDLMQKENISKKEAKAAIHKLMDSFAQMVLDNEEPLSWAMIIVREQLKPTEALDILYDTLIEEMQTASVHFMAIYTGLDPESDEIKIRKHALAGQVLGFLTDRECLLRHMGVKKLTPEHTKLIRAIIENHVEACLNAPIPEKKK